MLEECQRLGFQCSDDSLENVLSSITSAAFFIGEMLGPVLGGAFLTFLSFQHLVEGVGGLGALLVLVYVLCSPRPRKEQD